MAGGSGEFHVRFYSFSEPQTLADALSVQFRYQSPSGPADNYAADLQADAQQQNVSARYSSGRDAFQVQARRQADPAQNSSTLSGTLSYSTSFALPPAGLAISSLAAYYAYNGSQSPTQAVQVNSGGVSVGLRLSDTLSSSVSGSASLVDIQAGTFSVTQRSATLSGGLYYRQGTTSASLNPSFTLSDDQARWYVGANAQTALRDDLLLSGTANVSSSSSPSASADLQYDASALLGEGTPRGKLSFGAAVSVTPPAYTLTGRVRTALTPTLSLGGSAAFTPATSDVTYSADASAKAGPVNISANASLGTRPDTAPALSVSTSVSSAQAGPPYGSVSLGYREQGSSQSANAYGTFGYRAGKFDVSTTLSLYGTHSAGSDQTGTEDDWVWSGAAEFSAAYAVQEDIDVSANLRYEPGSGPSKPARLRFGAGLRYRFP